MRATSARALLVATRLVLAAAAALPADVVAKLALGGCGRVFLDGGSNDGDSVRSFLGGGFFNCALNGPNRLYRQAWPRMGGKERRAIMAPLREPHSFCVRSFEANPRLLAPLSEVESRLRADGRNVRFLGAALSNLTAASVPRNVTTYARNDFGSMATTLPFEDIFSNEKKVRRLGSEIVKVPSYDVHDVLRHAVSLNASSTLALKLDVEGDEEWMINRLADAPELLCSLSYLFVEFHHLPGGKPGSGRANLTRWGLPEDHYERVKRRIHTAMEERPGCKLHVYWRSFWSACGDVMRFQWQSSPQATDEPDKEAPSKPMTKRQLRRRAQGGGRRMLSGGLRVAVGSRRA